MTIAPLSILYRGTRRVRAVFSGALASGAFTATGLYSFANLDGAGASPINVVAVFAIANSPQAVELAIDSDLASGALYRVGFANVPCSDATLYTGTYDARVGLQVASQPNSEPVTQNLDLLLYSRDIVFVNDFVVDATGDLVTTTGRANWVGAVSRRVGSDGIGWDPAYGLKAEKFVDAPSRYQKSLAGNLLAQATADDRTLQASVAVVSSPATPYDWQFQLTIKGKDNLAGVALTVPPQS
jgi:hypothetical protein